MYKFNFAGAAKGVIGLSGFIMAAVFTGAYFQKDVLLAVLAYTGFALVLHHLMVRVSSVNSIGKVCYKKAYPFERFGIIERAFSHVFYGNDVIGLDSSIVSCLLNKLSDRVGITPPEFVEFVVSNDLRKSAPTVRLYRAETSTTSNTINIFLKVTISERGMVTVNWWIINQEPKDINVVIASYLYSWLTLPIITYKFIKGTLHPRTIFARGTEEFFDTFNTHSFIRQVETVMFNELISHLDSNGIDTSELREQRANVLSINVNGGNNNFGSVVQGSQNKVSGATK